MKMKLSTAIREGAKLRPQCRHAYFDCGGSCALGAAYEAVTGKTNIFGDNELEKQFLPRFPGIHRPVKHPANNQDGSLFGVIIKLNDREEWTREQIADWLEQQGY